MRDKEKELLKRMLCYYLPFGLKGQMYNDKQEPAVYEVVGIKYNAVHAFEDGKTWSYVVQRPIEEFKPYLRPMSTMTFEETRDFLSIGDNDSGGYLLKTDKQDWLNAHHFDYCGFIEERLALEAPENMYNIKKK